MAHALGVEAAVVATDGSTPKLLMFSRSQMCADYGGYLCVPGGHAEPFRVLQQLGLAKVATKKVKSSLGTGEAAMHEAVRLTIQGRSCTMDVMEVPDGVPVLVGQIPRHHLDLVVDLRSQTLVGNPAHGGEHMVELY